MNEFILSILASLVASYIIYLCNKIKNHFSSANRKSGCELNIKIKFKKF
ncbi:MAG: type I toxin-antitoxin system toxin [Paraclostridium sp.]